MQVYGWIWVDSCNMCYRCPHTIHHSLVLHFQSSSLCSYLECLSIQDTHRKGQTLLRVHHSLRTFTRCPFTPAKLKGHPYLPVLIEYSSPFPPRSSQFHIKVLEHNQTNKHRKTLKDGKKKVAHQDPHRYIKGICNFLSSVSTQQRFETVDQFYSSVTAQFYLARKV